jgi:hypothetical protein
MKIFLLRIFNRITWCYAYLGLIYALYFIYFIVVPSYRQQNRLSNTMYLFFNVIFLYFFLQGYINLILIRFSSISFCDKEKTDRYCKFCLDYTRERSHHCYLCQTCIPIQDHHCFFVGTCIGKHNQKYFLLMLFHLLCAHFIGYIFVYDYLWNEIGGLKFLTIFKILFFNIGYVIGFVKTKWQAFICFHHYLVYFDIIFISKLFYQIMKRSLNGQTQYEEKKMIFRNKQSFSQIFGSNKWILIFPFIRS